MKEPGQGATISEAEGLGPRFSKAVGRAEVRRWGMLPMPNVPGIDQQRNAAVQLGVHAKLVGLIKKLFCFSD